MRRLRGTPAFGILATMLAASPVLAQQVSLPIAQPRQDNATTQTIAPMPAAANINLTPRRVIFDRNKRTEAVGAMGPITQVATAEGPALAIPLRRQGTTSLYGNIELRTAKEIVGVVRGIAVYPEVDERMAVVPLLRPLKKGETVTATFVSDEARKPAPIATGAYTAP